MLHVDSVLQLLATYTRDSKVQEFIDSLSGRVRNKGGS